jgi:predicted Zn-dependent peptidase
LRLAIQTVKSTKAVAIGILVGTGSAYENAENNGISHFTEHMLFKGTAKRTAFQIADEPEGIGAQINAATGREYTLYYTISLSEHFKQCADILSDMLFNSTFLPVNIDKERGVIIEEINGCSDDPSDLVGDLSQEAYYGKQGLGRTILGPIDNIKKFTQEDFFNYQKERYTADNTVISVAGCINEKEAIEIVRSLFADKFTNLELTASKTYKSDIQKRYIESIKTISQANAEFMFPAFKSLSKQSKIASIIGHCLGGGMSSRLFQEIREELGLAYEVYCSQMSCTHEGSMTVSFATDPKNIVKATKAMRKILDEACANGLTDEEIQKTKEQLKSATVLGTESASSLMRSNGMRVLRENRLFDVRRAVKEIDSIKPDDVNKLIKKIFVFSKVSCGYVGGKYGKKNLLEVLGD